MMEKRGSKKGQITIFVIIALVIVGAIIIFFAFTNSGRNLIDRITGAEIDFNSEVRNCIENNEEINAEINLVMSQGGKLDPTNYVLYYNSKLDYLCYTNEYYKGCVMQNPNLIFNIEKELKKAIEDNIKGCYIQVSEELESRGYSVEKGNSNITIDIIPKKILIRVKYPITVTKEDVIFRYENLDFVIKSESYQLISIASSILNYEARYGDSESLAYMTLYPNVRVNKIKLGDSSTAYILTDRETNDKFGFAVRSFAWPPGYKI